jgi:5-methyltetrahydropteroyltriglutamate--homocysteine methyltransferase
LIEAVETAGDGAKLDPLYDAAIRDTIARFEATGSPVISDGEQRKYHNFSLIPGHGVPNPAGWFQDPFRDPSTPSES